MTTTTERPPRGVPPRAVTAPRRAAWRRPRFGLGLLLVAGSVALGSWAVQSASAGEAVWVAAGDLAPGDRIGPEDLREVTMRWEGRADLYADAGSLPADAVVVAFVGAGELVPLRAVGAAADVDGRPVTVPVPDGTEIAAGTLVDLWSIPSSATDGEPASLAEGVLVLGVDEAEGVFASGGGRVARVLVSVEQVPRVLAAQARSGTLVLVENPGS